MRVLELPPNQPSRVWGQIHGESYRGEIQALADIRTYLTVEMGRFSSEEEVLMRAKQHLPVLANYSTPLYEELVGIAEGAAVNPRANHRTQSLYRLA